MPRLEISLLGTFQVALDGVPVTRFGADTARAVLAYLEGDMPEGNNTPEG
jgi:DNA-binding SARP family transcriptional activator